MARSTKPSGGRSTQRPPSQPTFFLDENLGGKTVTGLLRDAGISVERFLEHFTPGLPDDAWIPDVTARGWIIVTTDSKFRYHENERRALQAAGAKVFKLSAAQLRGAEQAAILLKAIPKMIRMAERTAPPFMASVTKAGDVAIRWPEPER